MRATLMLPLMTLLLGTTMLLSPQTVLATDELPDLVAPAHAAPAHMVTESQLDAALAIPGDDRDAQERRLQALLARPEVSALAEGAGLDLARAQRAVPTLTDDELADLSARVAQVDAAVAGGDNIIITPYGLTVILLIIIIVILVA